MSSVRVGPITFHDFVTYLVTSREGYAGDDDGLIGADFLHLFTVGLDYANSRIYLVPNDLGRRVMNIRD